MFQPASQPASCSQPVPVSQPVPASPHVSPPEALPPEALPPEARAALASLLGEGRVVAHRPCFARLFGGAACGVLLSQFWFWTGTPTVQARADGWFWKPQREITDETGLSRAETATARRRLCAQGVLEEKRCGIPSTLHFRLDMGAVLRLLWAHLQAQAAPPEAALAHSGTRGSRTLVCVNPASKFAGIAQTTSETTSKKTQEMTQTRARPVSPPALADRDAERGPDRNTDRNTLRKVRVTAALGAVVRAAEAAIGTTAAGTTAAGTTAAGTTAIGTAQQAVNLSGVARLKAALAAAGRGSARPASAADRAPPDAGR